MSVYQILEALKEECGWLVFPAGSRELGNFIQSSDWDFIMAESQYPNYKKLFEKLGFTKQFEIKNSPDTSLVLEHHTYPIHISLVRNVQARLLALEVIKNYQLQSLVSRGLGTEMKNRVWSFLLDAVQGKLLGVSR